MFGAKAEMAAIEKGIAWKRVLVPFSIQSLYEPKSEIVRRINPKHQVPVLIDGDLEIFDSTQIFECLEDLCPNPLLWPETPQDRARARMLELRSDEIFFPDVARCMPARRAAVGEQEFERSVARIHKTFIEMDRQLEGRMFLASTFSYADLAFYSAQFFARFLGQSSSPNLQNLERWREEMGRRESVRQVLGEMSQFLTANGIRVP